MKTREKILAKYQEFTTLPAWTRAVWLKTGRVKNYRDPFKWSGDTTPPAIGDKIKVYMSGFGTGTVLSYFVEYGWLGLLVKLDNPPKWYVEQNNGNPAAHIFGIDLQERTVGKIAKLMERTN